MLPLHQGGLLIGEGLVKETDTSTKKFVTKKCPWPPEHYKKIFSHSYLFRTLETEVLPSGQFLLLASLQYKEVLI